MNAMTLVLFSASLLANLAFVVLLFKVYKNAKVVESPDNIVNGINLLGKEIKSLEKAITTNYQDSKKGIDHKINQLIDALANYAKENRSDLQGLHSSSLSILDEKINRIVESSSSIAAATGESKEQLLALRNYASKQDKEIDRHRIGYDLVIIKKFATPIISVIDKIETANKENTQLEPLLEEVAERLILLLESHDIEKFKVPIGEHHKNVPNLDSFSQLEAGLTTNKESDGLIKEAPVQPYVYLQNDEPRVLRKGTVLVNKYSEE